MPTPKKPPRPPPLSISLPSVPTRPNSDESPHSPLRSDDPQPPTSSPPPSKIHAVEKYYSPLTSPPPEESTIPDNSPPPISHQHVISLNQRDEPAAAQTGVVYGETKGRRGIVNLGKKDGLVKMVSLGVRVLEIVFCLVSFSVMASNKTQGWTGDSFDRYREYRFCLTVTILGFVYSVFQTYDLSYHLGTGKHVIKHHLRPHFDFILDQIIAYLLISASSAAATRVNDWEANWGKDAFTEKASASVSMAFLAFFAFAISSLISGFNLLNRYVS